ncbi:MAG: SPOR domain-containing protein [Gammaproteobacteria bacterium]
MMKWIAIFLLLINVGYFGLQINNSLKKTAPASTPSQKMVKNSTKSLVLLSELEELPMLREGQNVIEKELENNMPEMEMGKEIPFDSFGTCLSIGPYQSDIEVIDLNNWLQFNRIPHRERIEEKRTSERYWVYLAPQTEAKAKAQLQELRRKGLKDYYLIGKGDMKNAISLGLFSRQSTVNNRLAELKKVGYNPVVVPQHKITKLMWLDIQINDGQNLPELTNTLKTVNIDCKTIALLGSDQ